MAQKSLELLCSRETLERRNSILWLVGSRFMPHTIISVLHCLHFHEDNSQDPDFAAEADIIRILLPRGLEIIGSVLNEVGSLETARRAGELAFKVATHISSYDSSKSPSMIAACLDQGNSFLHFYSCRSFPSDDIEAYENVEYHENPSMHLWTNMCLLRSELQLRVPVYAKSFANPSDYKAQLSRAVDDISNRLSSERLFCLIEGSSGMKRTLVQASLPDGAKKEIISNVGQVDLQCSNFCSSDSFTSPYGLQMPIPVTLTFMLHHSRKKEENSAPYVEYLPVFGGAVLRVLNLNLAAICIAHKQLSIHEAVTCFAIPALNDQLLAMKDMIFQEFVEHTKVYAYNFCSPGLIHPISCIYDVTYGEAESKTIECRRMIHRRLNLPLDRPLFRVANALSFPGVHAALDAKRQGRSRLSNVHINMPTGSVVVGGHCSVIQGSYDYYHYLQDNIDDNGWGCAYRSLQTIISWFRLQHYTVVEVPTHEKIQEALVEIGDKEPSFKGSQNWIGAIELSFVLDKLLGVSSKILNVRSGAELPDKCRELAYHFETQGTPVMIGGGVLAYTLLGVDYNGTTGDCAFLILDPHYTGGEDLKCIWGGGWCAWKKPISPKGEEFFLRNKFYNLLLPQRPSTI